MRAVRSHRLPTPRRLLPLLGLSACLSAFLADGSAAAQSRPLQQRIATNRMSCADAKALVKQDGDVSLGTGPGGVPERIVADRSFCEFTEIAELRFVPTRDNPQCPVGYRCKAPEFEDWNWR